jgi:hypothetical protein
MSHYKPGMTAKDIIASVQASRGLAQPKVSTASMSQMPQQMQQQMPPLSESEKQFWQKRVEIMDDQHRQALAELKRRKERERARQDMQQQMPQQMPQQMAPRMEPRREPRMEDTIMRGIDTNIEMQKRFNEKVRQIDQEMQRQKELRERAQYERESKPGYQAENFKLF